MYLRAAEAHKESEVVSCCTNSRWVGGTHGVAGTSVEDAALQSLQSSIGRKSDGGSGGELGSHALNLLGAGEVTLFSFEAIAVGEELARNFMFVALCFRRRRNPR